MKGLSSSFDQGRAWKNKYSQWMFSGCVWAQYSGEGSSLERSGSGHIAPPLSSLSYWKQPAMGSLELTRRYNSCLMRKEQNGWEKGRKKGEQCLFTVLSSCCPCNMAPCRKHASLTAAFCSFQTPVVCSHPPAFPCSKKYVACLCLGFMDDSECS